MFSRGIGDSSKDPKPKALRRNESWGPVSQVLGWLTTMAMTIAAIALALS
jgi:hypothetical protein